MEFCCKRNCWKTQQLKTATISLAHNSESLCDQWVFCWPQMDPLDTKSSASLYTGAELNLRDRVVGEVEKNSFIIVPGKGLAGGDGHIGLMPSSKLL